MERNIKEGVGGGGVKAIDCASRSEASTRALVPPDGGRGDN
jgi:hypothetical protein